MLTILPSQILNRNSIKIGAGGKISYAKVTFIMEECTNRTF